MAAPSSELFPGIVLSPARSSARPRAQPKHRRQVNGGAQSGKEPAGAPQTTSMESNNGNNNSSNRAARAASNKRRKNNNNNKPAQTRGNRGALVRPSMDWWLEWAGKRGDTSDQIRCDPPCASLVDCLLGLPAWRWLAAAAAAPKFALRRDGASCANLVRANLGTTPAPRASRSLDDETRAQATCNLVPLLQHETERPPESDWRRRAQMTAPLSYKAHSSFDH